MRFGLLLSIGLMIIQADFEAQSTALSIQLPQPAEICGRLSLNKPDQDSFTVVSNFLLR